MPSRRQNFLDFVVKTNSVMIPPVCLAGAFFFILGMALFTDSVMSPPVCLAGAFFFDLWHVPFQKNTYIAVFGTKINPNHTNPLQAPSPFNPG